MPRRFSAPVSRVTPRKPVLIVLHQEHSTPGRVGRLLTDMGYLLDIRRPRFDDGLPDTMDGHAGAIIFGGPMSANDPDPYIQTEIDWIGVCLKERAPFLGLCLGAQMLSRHLGGTVSAHPELRAEIGYYPIMPTPEGEALTPAIGRAWPDTVYQWHREGFDCPPGARCLAEGPGDFPVQAIAVDDAAIGLQFHPEVTHAMMHRWTTRAWERLELPGAQPRQAHLEGWFRHDARVADWLRGFLPWWLARGRGAGD
jgi:GMP synthase (glutamine-hydrolysing)